MSCSSCGTAGGNAQKNTTTKQPCNAKKQPCPAQILNNVNLWPKDFQRPTSISNICVKTYVFKKYPSLFLAYVQKNLPNVPVKIDQDNKGYTMVTLTGVGSNGTISTQNPPSVNNDEEAIGTAEAASAAATFLVPVVGTLVAAPLVAAPLVASAAVAATQTIENIKDSLK